MINLEDIPDIPEYKISDVFFPLKHLRYIPKIMKIEDAMIKIFEIGTNLAITATQIAIYYPLYENIVCH